jgi:hypothetical protein
VSLLVFTEVVRKTWHLALKSDFNCCHRSYTVSPWYMLCWNKKTYKSQITRTCWIVIDCCEFSGTYCKISETHFRVLEEWYGYLENVVE